MPLAHALVSMRLISGELPALRQVRG